MNRITANRLFWPLLSLVLLLAANLFEIRSAADAAAQEATSIVDGSAMEPRGSFCEREVKLVAFGDTELLFTLQFFKLEVRNGCLYGTLVEILKWGSIIAALACGMTLVIATGGIDLSVGSMIAVGGGIAAMLVTKTELNFGLVILITLAACTLAGTWNGVLVAYAGIQPFVATLILMVAGRGIAQEICRGQIVTFDGHAAFESIYSGSIGAIPICVVVVALLFVATGLLVRRTAVGLFVESVGNNASASRFSGINARAVKVMAYAFCGLCAGVAGLIDASSIRGADCNQAGRMFELYAIFAVVVGGASLTGGRFTLLGSLIGAILFQTLRHTMYAFGVRSDVVPAYLAIIIIAVCLLQSPEFRAKLWRRRDDGRLGSDDREGTR